MNRTSWDIEGGEREVDVAGILSAKASIGWCEGEALLHEGEHVVPQVGRISSNVGDRSIPTFGCSVVNFLIPRRTALQVGLRLAFRPESYI